MVYVVRCYKYLGYGHQSRECKGPDHSAFYYKCGKKVRKAVSCTEKLQFILFKELEKRPGSLSHIPGSDALKSFRQALDKLKSNRE